MLKEVVKFVTGLFEGLGTRVRWSLLTVLVFGTALLIVVAELFTGFAYYGSLQRQVNLLNELHSLAQDDIRSRPELYPVYE